MRRKIGPSKRTAERVLHKLETAVVENRYLDVRKKTKIRFEELTTQYLSYANTNKRSWDMDEISIKSLKKKFARKYLYGIDSYLIERYIAERLTKVTPATVNREIACLKHMLNEAVEWEMAGENPAKKVKLLTENNERTRYLKKEEIKIFL